MFDVILFLVLIQIKHFYFDFVNQSDNEIANKGVYGNLIGMGHSLKHGLGTFAVGIVFVEWHVALFVALIDTIMHYHIDWFKMRFGGKDLRNKRFWIHFGLDQLSHQLTYLLILVLLML